METYTLVSIPHPTITSIWLSILTSPSLMPIWATTEVKNIRAPMEEAYCSPRRLSTEGQRSILLQATKTVTISKMKEKVINHFDLNYYSSILDTIDLTKLEM